MGKAKGKRIRKVRSDPVAAKAREIGVPEAQVGRGDLALRDVANHNDNDQRAMVRQRAGEERGDKARQTVRRLTRIEQLAKKGEITPEQARACQWYANAHELGFQTVGCTANYGGAGGGAFGSSDLLARYSAQAEARENFYYARRAIPDHLVVPFESIVLGSGRPVHMLPKNDRARFSMAAHLLYGQIAHLLIAA